MKKIKIEVRSNGKIEIIFRVLRCEQIGNFCPIFCTYKGKRTLVFSDEGDLSDPFRRDETYTDSLFIIPSKQKSNPNQTKPKKYDY